MTICVGMNMNERELVQHVEYETDTYYASFSAEFEISCSPLWRLLIHCNNKESAPQLVGFIYINLPFLFVTALIG